MPPAPPDPGRVGPPILLVDAANVVGSVPNRWWRDRAGAARKLRDALLPVSTVGLPGLPGPLEVVLVVEGAATGVEPISGVRVVAAPGSGDDTLVGLATAASVTARRCVVVTADRELRGRLRRVAAEVLGPRTIPYP